MGDSEGRVQVWEKTEGRSEGAGHEGKSVQMLSDQVGQDGGGKT